MLWACVPAMTPNELKEILEFAVDATREAGRLTLGYFREGVRVETKADDSPVTIADRVAEELLRERIAKAFPGHGILGEEFGEQEGSEPARWILDPVDGTFAFVSGVPLYTNLVGLEWRGEMVLGVINAPAVSELVCGAKGLGARWNGRPARVSEVARLSEARIATTSTRLLARHGREAAYRRLRRCCREERGWPDAYAFLLLATGRVDVVLEGIMSVWDNAAPAAVVTAAGGSFTDWRGRPTHRAPEALATNGRLLDAVLERLRGEEAAAES